MRRLAVTLCLGLAVGCGQQPAAAPSSEAEPGEQTATVAPLIPSDMPTAPPVTPTPTVDPFRGASLPCSEADKIATSMADVQLAAPGDAVLLLMEIQQDYYRVGRLAQAAANAGGPATLRVAILANEAGDAAAESVTAFAGLVSGVVSEDFAKRRVRKLADALKALGEYCAAARNSEPGIAGTTSNDRGPLDVAADLPSLLAAEPDRPLSTAIREDAWQEVAIVQAGLKRRRSRPP